MKTAGWRTSKACIAAGVFAPPRADHIADQVAAAASRAPGLPGHQPWLDVNLPDLKLANATLSEVQVGRLLGGLRDLLTSQESGTVAVYVQLGAVLSAVRAKLPNRVWGGWLAASCINMHTANRAMRYHEAVGDGDGRVDMERLADLLRRHGYARFSGVGADEIKPWDVSCRTLSATIKAARDNTRAVESAGSLGKLCARAQFDGHPDLREDAKAAEIKEVSLSSRAGGVATRPAGPFVEHLRVAGGASPTNDVPAAGPHGGGGAVGMAGGVRGPAAGDAALRGRGGGQMLIDFDAASAAREVAELLDAGAVGEREMGIVRESLRVALAAARRGRVRVVPVADASGSGGAVGAAAPTSQN